jgi:hypothetical protein
VLRQRRIHALHCHRNFDLGISLVHDFNGHHNLLSRLGYTPPIERSGRPRSL